MMRLYAVWDKKAERVLGTMLMLFVNDGSAVRQFMDMIGNVKSLGAHASDFDLVVLGLFDPESGAIVVEPVRVVLMGSVAKDSLVVSDAS